VLGAQASPPAGSNKGSIELVATSAGGDACVPSSNLRGLTES